MKKLNAVLHQLREEAGYTQEELSQMLWVSRVTLANIESGKRDAKDMLSKYRDIFDVREDFIKNWQIKYPKISVKPWNIEKFKELVLYILHKVGMQPNIWKTVLYKLLYFCDFDFYEKTWKSITGISYVKLPRWPAPYRFDEIVNTMIKDKELLSVSWEYKWYVQQRFLPNKIYQKIFSTTELGVIDWVLEHYSNSNASEISEYSHWDIPWKQTEDMEIINYSLAKKREYPYSIIARENKKKQAFAEIRASGMFDDLADEPDLYEDYR